jgi:predicted site-specific integrase-resolvase
MTPLSGKGQDHLVRLDAAARELGVVSKTVRKYCACGLLKCQRLPSNQWRVYRSSLDALKSKTETYPN